MGDMGRQAKGLPADKKGCGDQEKREGDVLRTGLFVDAEITMRIESRQWDRMRKKASSSLQVLM